MTLIIGGAGQGKLDYALDMTGLGPQDVARTPEEKKPILYGLQSWVKAHPDETLDALLFKNPDVIILCDEVGCGVVPMDPGERAWREAVGRLCCKLAAQADRVERIFCGLPTVLKGAGTWK